MRAGRIPALRCPNGAILYSVPAILALAEALAGRVTPRQAAALVHRTPGTILRWISSNRLDSVVCAGGHWVRPRDVRIAAAQIAPAPRPRAHVSVEETAARTGIVSSTLYWWIRGGKLPSRGDGVRYWIPEDAARRLAPDPGETYLWPAQAAEATGLSRDQLAALASTRVLDAVRTPGGTHRYPRSQLQRLTARSPARPPPPSPRPPRPRAPRSARKGAR